MQPILRKNYRLDQLYSILSYELSGAALFGLSFFYGIAFYLLAAAVIVFIPYLVYVLLAEKCYGWTIALFVIVIIPGLAGTFFLETGMWAYVIQYSVVGAFFLYCHLLKITLPSYMD